MRTIFVLLWKHLMVRRRRICSSITEFLLPILLYLAVLALKPFLFEPSTAHRDLSAVPQQIKSSHWFLELGSEKTTPNSVILYHPNTTLANKLMDEIGSKLSLRRFNHNTVSSMKNCYFPYTNRKQLLSFQKVMRPEDAIIIFHNLNGDTLPTILNYSIWTNINWNSFLEFDKYIPRSQERLDNGRQYLTLMRLQWVIDSSYIKLRSGAVINQTVSLRELIEPRAKGSLVGIFVLFIMVCMLAPMTTFVILLVRLLADRNSGIEELIKMDGVRLRTLAFSHYLNALPGGLVFSLIGLAYLKLNPPVTPATNGVFIFLILLLYFNSIMSLSFTCSYMVNQNETSATFSVLIYLGTCMLIPLLIHLKIPVGVKVLIGVILPHMSFIWFMNELFGYEEIGQTISMTKPIQSFEIAGVYSLIGLLLQIPFYYCLCWYMSLVRPGKYGHARPWHLHLLDKLKFKGTPKPVAHHVSKQEEQYFEKPPKAMKVGIFVDNVSKVYGHRFALKNVTLKVLEGEITVLLGHNGAGKTTLMSIITGVTGATSGRILVSGLEASSKEARRQIALCPQHNIFISEMTLQEHLIFFTLLKGGNTFRDARERAKKLAAELGLEDKLDYKWLKLSGGMQRRAQLACALAGNANVLILDEPTSGLDVGTRREIWDVLLKLRGARTVLLSTHFMEEVDALGDRVAALHEGELRCFATNMYLKRSIGDGYRLTLITTGQPKEKAITEKVLESVPDATIKEKRVNSISYNLPAASSSSFSKLFSNLEESKAKLHIESIGVGVSTLEDVFLKLCSNVKEKEEHERHKSLKTKSQDLRYYTETYFRDLKGASHQKTKGPILYCRQFLVLFKRQLLQIWSRKWSFLVWQIIAPIIYIFAMTHMSNEVEPDPSSNTDETVGRIYARVLDDFIDADVPSKTILYKLQMKENGTALIRNMKELYPGVEFFISDDFNNPSLRTGKLNVTDNKKSLFEVIINDTDVQLLYRSRVRYMAPDVLNILSNVLGRSNINQSTPYILTKELIALKSDIDDPPMPKSNSKSMMWGYRMSFVIQIAAVHCITVPLREKTSEARHIYIMSGCSIWFFWMCTLVSHLAITFVFQILPLIIAAVTMDTNATLNQSDFLLVLVFVMLLGCLAYLWFLYCLSIYISDKSAVTTAVVMVLICGFILPFIKSTWMDSGVQSPNIITYLIDFIEYIATPNTFSIAIMRIASIAATNAFFTIVEAEKLSYFRSPQSLIILVIHFAIYVALVLLSDYGVFKKLGKGSKNKDTVVVDKSETVKKERAYIAQQITKCPADIEDDAMLIHEVHKIYSGCCAERKLHAVQGTSFSVKKGECFGLLGVNGAGKSSTFKMMTAREPVTEGLIYANGYFLKDHLKKYLHSLGYCPQFHGLDLFLTGSQNLSLLLTLRGVNKEVIKKEVKGWIKLVGLENYADQRVETYSGGCQRRIVAAAALCGGAPLTLLDEPTSGVDVGARRNLWGAIRKALYYNRSIIITSHSMDEMEALCARIAIMCAGRVRALGAAAALRAEFAAGHAVRFKLAHTPIGKGENRRNEFMSRVQEIFNCTLHDQHRTMLHYHINEKMHYSDLFTSLEGLKEKFSDVLEDYSVTETTLEEVFLGLAEETKAEQAEQTQKKKSPPPQTSK